MAGDRVVFRSDRLYVSDPGWTPEGPVVTAETIGPFDVVIDGAGIKVTHPSDWYQAREDLTPNAGLPQRVAVGTYGLGPGGPRCAHMPVTAMRDLGPTDVFLYLEEGVPIASPGEWDARPATFAGWLTGIDEGTDAWECMRDDERGHIGALRWLAFAESGRGLHLLAVIGREASADDVATAADILDSLEVEPPPGEGFMEFRPETETIDGRPVVDLMFTDGSIVQASWPAELELATDGVRPRTWTIARALTAELIIRQSMVEDVVDHLGAVELLEEIEDGRGGLVTLWRLYDGRGLLGFQFGSWAVLVSDPGGSNAAIDTARRTWARELYGAVTGDGFLILSGGPSIRVATPHEDPAADLSLLSGRGVVQINLTDCRPDAVYERFDDGDGIASWCSSDGLVLVTVTGPDEFATEAHEGLELVAPPAETGTLAGEVRADEGRFPGVDELTQGRVTVTGDEMKLVLDVDGVFELRLPVGEYEVTATFANGLACESQRVTISDSQTAEVEIVCNMR
jgi:hypothetical protein